MTPCDERTCRVGTDLPRGIRDPVGSIGAVRGKFGIMQQTHQAVPPAMIRLAPVGIIAIVTRVHPVCAFPRAIIQETKIRGPGLLEKIPVSEISVRENSCFFLNNKLSIMRTLAPIGRKAIAPVRAVPRSGRTIMFQAGTCTNTPGKWRGARITGGSRMGRNMGSLRLRRWRIPYLGNGRDIGSVVQSNHENA